MAPRRKFLKTREKNFDSLIPRPRGAAKRDFALQDEMRLHGEDATYNSIQYEVRKIAKNNGLRLDATIRFQSPLVLASITKKAMSRIPHLAKFEHGWPVKELIQQYLQNHCDYVKRKGRDKSKPKVVFHRLYYVLHLTRVTEGSGRSHKTTCSRRLWRVAREW